MFFFATAPSSLLSTRRSCGTASTLASTTATKVLVEKLICCHWPTPWPPPPQPLAYCTNVIAVKISSRSSAAQVVYTFIPSGISKRVPVSTRHEQAICRKLSYGLNSIMPNSVPPISYTSSLSEGTASATVIRTVWKNLQADAHVAFDGYCFCDAFDHINDPL